MKGRRGYTIGDGWGCIPPTSRSRTQKILQVNYILQIISSLPLKTKKCQRTEISNKY